ncbi:helicase associated domain-containing protein [Streptomyces sp. NPDC004266]|uniref:helicase associated domain-containing protein n=1 Tax=Streptomyces sp. NPDC004266 TaxID=3364693 RepID=UPI00367614B8
MRYGAVHQFYECEGHPTVPRKHVETVVFDGDGEGQEQREVLLKLGAWVGSQRSRAASPAPERIEQLPAIGMRWA